MTKQMAAKPHKYQLRGYKPAAASLADRLLARFGHCTLSA